MKKIVLLVLLFISISACNDKKPKFSLDDLPGSNESVFYSVDFDRHPEIDFEENGKVLKQKLLSLWPSEDITLGLGKRIDDEGSIQFIGVNLVDASFLEETKRSIVIDNIIKSVEGNITNLSEFDHILVKYEMAGADGSVTRSEKEFKLN